MTITMREALTQIGARALVGVAERVDAWASAPEPVAPPEPVSESFSGPSSDVALFSDDIGWIPLAMGETSYLSTDLRPIDRFKIVQRARVYYVRDAYSRNAIRLHTVYCVGRGMSIKARDYRGHPEAQIDNPDDPGADVADEDDAQTVALQQEADAFWEHPENDSVFSDEAQARFADRLNVDGELFYLLIPPDPENVNYAGEQEPDGVTRVRAITDCLQITRILKNPEDDSEIWYYLRVSSERGKIVKRLYPDHRLYFTHRDDDGTVNLPSVNTGASGGTDPYTVYGGDLDGVKVVTNQYIYHQKVNTIGERGNSLLTPAMDWSKVNRQYLEDRATISKAHAKFAWKRMIKGSASAVAAFGRKTISGQQAVSGFPLPSASGQTLNVNPGVDWEPMNAQDGGKNAYIESRNFRLMFYAAVGFGEHYFGDGSMGTRATSTQMERPTELMLQAFQHILTSGYEVMFAFHLATTGREYDAHAVWVDAPSILENDLQSTITSILSVIGVLPQFDIDEIILKMLQAFGVDDPQDVLIKIRERQEELYYQNLQLAAITAGLDTATAAAAGVDATANPSGHAAAQANLIDAQAKYLQMVSPPGDPTKQPGPKVGPQFAQGPTKGAPLVMRKPTPPRLRPNSNASP